MQNTYSLKLRNLILLLVGGLVFISCARKDLIKPGDPLDVAYEKAMNFYQNEDYGSAADAFETVIRVGRGTEYGRNAQFYLAESYFNNERYLLAASEYERYRSLYPRSERRELVDFREAYCYYKLSPRYRLSQKYTRTAIEKFRLFNSRYPDSERVQDASQYITDLRSKLAHKLYGAADLYMRVDQYEAAIIYYDLTIDRYPETDWAELALVNQINAYVVYAGRSIRTKQEERYQSAIEAYEKYLQLFPDGKYRSRAERYVDEARVGLANIEDAPAATSPNISRTDQQQ
ncbi:MAG: outer membrane protein assembly factor BamD [Balneolaceae bacterium]|nr:outer membrane protein assembly factor BamD [Balneolaceae bacterium]